MKKKKIIATASAVALAAVMAVGGTLAYYQGQAEYPVENTLVDQGNSVSIAESDWDGDNDYQSNTYSIIPGTTDSKDPVVTAEYTLDSYVYVTVDDTTGDLITWDAASAWTKLAGYDNVYYLLLKTVKYESGSSDWTDGTASDTYTHTDTETGYTYTYTYDSNGPAYTVSSGEAELYTYTVATSTDNTSKNPIDVYTSRIHVIEDDSIIYSTSITNDTYTGYGQVISLDFGAYIIQADIAGTDNVSESALSCWNALCAGNTTNTVSVNAGNVAVITITATDESGNTTLTTTTSSELVVTSADNAYSVIVPAGVTIDTDTADIVTDSSGNTTTTLILAVEEVGENYTTEGLTVSNSAGETTTVYELSIIGVHDNNTTVMEISMDIGTGLYNVKVEHEGEDMTALEAQQSTTPYTDDSYYYDSVNGILYIYTDNFSEFAVTYLEESNIVAENTDTESVYGSLVTALDEAKTGETVKLMADTEFDSAYTLSAGRTVTLDLNGHTVSQSSSFSSNWIIAVNGTLTVKDGSEKGTGSIVSNNYYGILVNVNSSDAAAVLNIESGTIKNEGTAITYASAVRVQYGTVNMTGGTLSGLYGMYLYPGTSTANVSGGNITATTCGIGIYAGSILNLSGGTIVSESHGVYVSGTDSVATITGGEVKADKYGLYVYSGTAKVSGNGTKITGTANTSYGVYIANSGSTASVSIEDGTISGKTYGIYINGNSKGSVTVSGGNVAGGSAAVYKYYYGSISLTGGTFSSNPSGYVASGYTVTTNSDGTYTVTVTSTTASDGE